MKKINPEKQYKRYYRLGIVSTILGLILVIIGSISYLWGTPERGINLMTLQPVIIDGSKTIFLGFVLLIGGCYRIFYKRKGFNERINIELNKRIEEDTKNLKAGHYSKKEIKKRTNPKRYKINWE